MACAPETWNGARCWMMYTPYRNSDPTYENPAFLRVNTDTDWRTPAAVVNPIVSYPGIGSYNSDPDHAFDPGNKRLVQIYRVVADSFNKIMIMSTANAKTWTAPALAFKEKNHDAVSPALVIDPDRSANIWYVRTGANGCNATSSSVWYRSATPTSDQRLEQADWSPATATNLTIPGSVIWHLDVTALPNNRGYVALVVAYTRGTSCGSSDLWLATSTDGVDWKTFAMPLFWRGLKLAAQRSISTWYRGTIRYYDATWLLHVWPSALAGPYWTVYHADVPLEQTLGLLGQASNADYKALNSLQLGIKASISMP